MATPKRPTEFPTPEETRLILSKVDRRRKVGVRDFAVLKLLSNGGLRKSELTGLTVGDMYDSQSGRYIYFKTLKQRKKRGKSEFKECVVKRKIPLDIETSTAIEKYLEAEYGHNFRQHRTEPMFRTTGLHGPYEKGALTGKAVDKLVHKYVSQCNLSKRLSPHSFRHRLLTEVLRNGFDLKTTQEIAGHSSLLSTQPYLHTNDELKRKAIEAVAV